MPIKLVISDPEKGRSYQVELKDPESHRLHGLKIGEKLDGGLVGIAGYELQITGGTDKDGFPMRPDISGSGRASVLLAGGVGFKPKKKGERRRRRIRGTQLSDAVVQLNTKVVKKGEKPLEEIFPPKEKPAEKKG